MSEAAEKFLIDQQIIQRSSERRREVLGCIACRWNTGSTSDGDPKVYGYQILRCRGILSGTLYPILQVLADANVIEPHDEIIDKPPQGKWGAPVRKTYTPVETDLGIAFRARLEKPIECQLSERGILLANLPIAETH